MNLRSLMDSLNVQEYQLQYLETTGKTYVPESGALIKRYLDHYSDVIEEGSIIFSDTGRAFIDDDKNRIIVNRGYSTLVYPSSVHEYLSPNNNMQFGRIKQKWRSKSYDPFSSVYFLSYLNNDLPDLVRKDFKRNFMIGEEKLDLRTIKNNISQGNENIISKSPYFSRCRRLYKHFLKDKTIFQLPPKDMAMLGLGCSLDGSFWNFDWDNEEK